jgi:hypothetical protein
MAVKKPLAVYSGKLKELQPGDTISGAVGSVNIKQAALDFGFAGISFQQFDIHDQDVTSDSLIVASLYMSEDNPAPDPWWMVNLIIRCGDARDGGFTMFVSEAKGGPVNGTYFVNYIAS